MEEVKHNRGEYPYSSRAPTIREVLFRAGLSARYLENQNGTRSRETLKARCKEKIKRVLRRVKSGRYNAARRTHKADGNRHEPSRWVELREKLQSLKQRWAEQELEYIDAQNCIQEYEGRLQELTAEVDRLRNLLAASNIHILHRPTGH
ncbi:hypothetical protein GRZ55_04660 [Chelativorans sp. ZYF759]|uniref:hypothetical protein n=1 Tax=Chelativorans sp. ZYF759 TaxID=2692213 RepID=UPI00145EE682|nr:hypothetical protein [Chelativorans sp. ZYF759]NMG38534.1 hypothetical protein [Chelativorans sp. ZYF759]